MMMLVRRLIHHLMIYRLSYLQHRHHLRRRRHLMSKLLLLLPFHMRSLWMMPSMISFSMRPWMGVVL